MGDKWCEYHWGDLATLEYGKRLQGYENGLGPYPVYGTNGLIGKYSEPLCDYPSVIIGRKGAYRGVHYSKEPFFVIDTAFYLKPKVNIDLKWAYYELLTHDINSMDSGSAIPSTSRDAFYNLPVMVPTLPEQRAIAHILGTLDDKIEVNRRMNETLEAMARTIFKSWFMDATENGIPKGWKVGTVENDFNLTMGQSPPGETYNEVGEGLPFFQGRADFGFRYPTKRVYCTAPTRQASPGDTLVSVRAPVGDINIATEQCCIGRGVAAIRHKAGSRSYTYYMMQSLTEAFERFEAEGTVFGSIGKNEFQTITLINPPVEVIHEFERITFPIDQSIENNEKQSRTLAAIRDSLLPKLLSGELRVAGISKV